MIHYYKLINFYLQRQKAGMRFWGRSSPACDGAHRCSDFNTMEQQLGPARRSSPSCQKRQRRRWLRTDARMTLQ